MSIFMKDNQTSYLPAGVDSLCKSCKKSGPTMACIICKAAPVLKGDPDVAHYCSKLCQQADWRNHKEFCKNLRIRTKLYSVTALSQSMFYIYRELTWARMDVKEAEINGKSMVLKVLKDDSAQEWIALSSKLFPNLKDRLAVLNFGACREAVAWTMVYLHSFLGVHIKEAKRIICYPKNSRINITAGDCTTDSMSHQLLKVTLHSGECYAIDISGAQYGYLKPIVSWEIYASTRIGAIVSENVCTKPTEKVFDVSDYSTEHIISQIEELNAKFNTPEPLSQLVRFSETVNFLFIQWQNGGDFSFDRMWKLPEEDRLRRQENLTNFVDWRFNVMLRGTRFTVNGKALVEKANGIWEFEGKKVPVLQVA